ncbi:MAG: leucyl aminopeptidase [Parcubacteria group bacterium]|nr:leucyl aminopeptidase [Parcubacteria group bacterium]
MNYTIVSLQKVNEKSAIVLYLFENESLPNDFLKLFSLGDQKYLKEYMKNNFDGKQKTARFVVAPESGRKIFFIGKGDEKNFAFKKMALKTRQSVQLANQYKIESVSIWIDGLVVKGADARAIVEQAVINSELAAYEFTTYKQQEEKKTLASIEFIFQKPKTEYAKSIESGLIIAHAVNYTRELVNIPGIDMKPDVLAREAVKIAKDASIICKVLDEKEMEKLKMGGVLGVGQGSDIKPKFIIMEYAGGKKGDKPLVLVGKGVTFDTGGLNLKPEEGMNEMWMDMSGGAAVINALGAIARLKIKLNVVGLVPAVENMPSGSSYHPGDILTTMSGKTIEILNTDAEGRVILSDALTYAEKYNPAFVVDIATLTGACMIALGLRKAGLFTKNHQIAEALEQLGDAAGEPIWHLPLDEEYEEEVKGTHGDVANLGKYKRYGGATTAAMFLYQFAKKYPWAHLDMAPVMTPLDGEHLAKGAKGFGVRFFVELARAMAAKKIRI